MNRIFTTPLVKTTAFQQEMLELLFYVTKTIFKN